MSITETGPAVLSSEFAQDLKLTKQQWFATSPEGQIRQSGGAYIGAALNVPVGDVKYISANAEAKIETFLVDSEGVCTPTGTNQTLIELFLPAATEMAGRVLTALGELGVTITSSAYLTASVTPQSTVTTTPHFDDDQYLANDGVGMVAIAASGAGPLIAAAPIPCLAPPDGLPIALDDRAVADFVSRSLEVNQAAANRIVVFPQFGQLHSGPDPAGLSGPRNLLVLRAGTLPTHR